MSTPLAIAAVTAVLQNFLQNSVTDLATVLGGPVTVSTEPPDRIDIGTASPDRINLFLFQATENQGWRNSACHRAPRTATAFPIPTSRSISSYLLTAYGSGPLHAEVLLGQAMFVLHEMPVLTRDAIRAVSATAAAAARWPNDLGTGRPDRADQDHAAGHVGRGNLENLVRAPVAISPDRSLQSVGCPDRKQAIRPADVARAGAQPSRDAIRTAAIDLLQSQANAGADDRGRPTDPRRLQSGDRWPAPARRRNARPD